MAEPNLHNMQIKTLYHARILLGFLVWCLGDLTEMHCSAGLPHKNC